MYSTNTALFVGERGSACGHAPKATAKAAAPVFWCHPGGVCIHAPPPPPNQLWVLVRYPKGTELKIFYALARAAARCRAG
jgi:hypothetical protein